jgi:hypothetical protein
MKKNNSKNFIIVIQCFLIATLATSSFVRVSWIIFGIIFLLTFLVEWLALKNIEKNVKAMNLKDLNLPDELKKKIDLLEVEMIEYFKSTLLEKEKCKDPHCPNCWGFGSGDLKDHGK